MFQCLICVRHQHAHETAGVICLPIWRTVIPVTVRVCNSLLITRETEPIGQFTKFVRYTRALTRDVIGVIILVQEWEAVKAYSFLGYPAGAKEVSNGFCYQKHDLRRIRHKYAFGTEWVTQLTIVGRMYVKAPVSSNIITTTVTVILITPLYNSHELVRHRFKGHTDSP